MGVLEPPQHPHLPASIRDVSLSRCLAVSQQAGNDTSNPAHTVRSSQLRATQRPANMAPRPRAAFSSVCHYWCHFLVANAIVTHSH